jgi:hypothetical protein
MSERMIVSPGCKPERQRHCLETAGRKNNPEFKSHEAENRKNQSRLYIGFRSSGLIRDTLRRAGNISVTVADCHAATLFCADDYRVEAAPGSRVEE